MILDLAVCQAAPVDLNWLTGAERRTFNSLRSDIRRASWRLGRWAAKTALARSAGIRPEMIEILAAPDGAPESPVGAISIAHRAGAAIALAGPEGARLGCDLELIEPRSPAFVKDYFLPAEQDAVKRSLQPEVDANLIWCGKEAALKIARTGLRRDTRSVRVTIKHSMDGPRGALFGPFVPIEIEDLETETPLQAVAARWSGFVLVLASTQNFQVREEETPSKEALED